MAIVGVLPALAISDTDCNSYGCAWAKASIDTNGGTAYADGASLSWTTAWSHTAHYRSWVNGVKTQDRQNSAVISSITFPMLIEPCFGPTTVTALTEAWKTSTGAYFVDQSVAASGNCQPYDSPIALDLDRSGAIEIGTKPKNFDLDADGVAEKLTEWFAGTGDGILYDATLPGAISGTHLFGDQGGEYPSGYEKLAQRDTDNSGTLSGTEFAGLAVWIDDGNARFHQSESTTVTELGIQTIQLSYDENYASTAEFETGETVLVQDIWFEYRK